MGEVTNKHTATLGISVKDKDGNVSTLQLEPKVATSYPDEYEIVMTPMVKARVEAGTLEIASGQTVEPEDAPDTDKDKNKSANAAGAATQTVQSTAKADDKKDGK